MRAFNVVRFRVKPGSEWKFIDVHREVRGGLARFRDLDCLGVMDPESCEVAFELPGGR